jgi:hypothetical protein
MARCFYGCDFEQAGGANILIWLVGVGVLGVSIAAGTRSLENTMGDITDALGVRRFGQP